MSEKPSAGRPRFMVTTLITLLAAGALALAISQGWVTDEDPVQLTVTAPAQVTLPPDGAGDVPFTYAVSLKNNTDETVWLEVANPCRIHRWFVADRGGNFVQGEPRETCTQAVMTAQLAPGAVLEDENTIALDARRYTRGERYQLMVSFWGHERIHVFEVR